MNDCVFSYIECCDCQGRCKGNYISVNSLKGNEILNEYQKELDPLLEAALKPLREKMVSKYMGESNEEI